MVFIDLEQPDHETTSYKETNELFVHEVTVTVFVRDLITTRTHPPSTYYNVPLLSRTR